MENFVDDHEHYGRLLFPCTEGIFLDIAVFCTFLQLMILWWNRTWFVVHVFCWVLQSAISLVFLFSLITTTLYQHGGDFLDLCVVSSLPAATAKMQRKLFVDQQYRLFSPMKSPLEGTRAKEENGVSLQILLPVLFCHFAWHTGLSRTASTAFVHRPQEMHQRR